MVELPSHAQSPTRRGHMPQLLRRIQLRLPWLQLVVTARQENTVPAMAPTHSQRSSAQTRPHMQPSRKRGASHAKDAGRCVIPSTCAGTRACVRRSLSTLHTCPQQPQERCASLQQPCYTCTRHGRHRGCYPPGHRIAARARSTGACGAGAGAAATSMPRRPCPPRQSALRRRNQSSKPPSAQACVNVPT